MAVLNLSLFPPFATIFLRSNQLIQGCYKHKGFSFLLGLKTFGSTRNKDCKYLIELCYGFSLAVVSD